MTHESQHLNVTPYERSESRKDYANGYKPKQLKNTHGQLDLRVPL